MWFATARPRAIQLSNSPTCIRRASSPRVLSGSRARRSSFVPFSPEGACGTTGRFTAPAAPMCREAHGNRVLRKHTANTATEAATTPAFRTRMDFAACCMSQGLSLAPTRPRSCELSPGHALGPSARLAGVCPLSRALRISDPASVSRSGIVAATASRSACRRRSPRAPYRDGMADKFSQGRGKVKQRRNKVPEICFLKIRNMQEAAGFARSKSIGSSLRGAKRRSNPARAARRAK